MPELSDVERHRRLAEADAMRRRIDDVGVSDRRAFVARFRCARGSVEATRTDQRTTTGIGNVHSGDILVQSA